MFARQPNPTRWILVALLSAAVAATACRFGPSGLATPPTGSPSPAPTTPAASPTLPGRTAVLNDIVGTVLSGPAGGGKDVPVTNGQAISEGAQVTTGKDSKATVNLHDGTILRLRPDTLVTLQSLAGTAANPFSRVLLALGKVFVILKGGQLEVQSPIGLATVTGSFLSVDYQASAKTMVVTCLEGNCSLRNNQAGVTLTTGQAASLAGGAGAAPVLRWMTKAEIQAWLDDNPEAQSVAPAALTALPTVTSTHTPQPPATAAATESATASATATRSPQPTVTPTLTPTSARRRITPSPTAISGQPLVYAFDNICSPATPNFPGTYHVTLTGPKSAAFDVAPTQSVKGSLPPGQYVIAWQSDTGQSQQMDYSSDQGPFAWTFCGKP